MKNETLSGSMPKQHAIARFVIEKKETIVGIIAALFILLFLYTALSKSFQIGNTVNVLKETPVFAAMAEPVAWGIVMAEYIAAALLFLPKTRKTGLYASLLLMSGFTIYLGYMMAFVPDLPCSCGGVISKMTWNQHLVFNIIFNLLALTGIVLERKRSNSRSEDKNSPGIVFT